MSNKLAIGTTIPVEGVPEDPVVEERKLAIGTSIPIRDAKTGNQEVYLEDRDETYTYPEADNEDELNFKLQTQIYGEDPNKFIMGVDTGINLLKSMGQGFAAFFPSVTLGTLAGVVQATGELAEKGPLEDSLSAARAGAPAKAIFETVLSIVAKQTGVDEDIAQAGKDLRAMANKLLNSKFFLPGETKAEQVAFDLGGAGASLFTAIGLSAVTKSLTAASALFGQIAASDTYSRVREEGGTPQEAYKAAIINFGTEFGLEFIGIEAFTKYLRGSKTITRIFAKATTEFFQESLQTLGSELSAKIVGFGEADWNKIAGDMIYSGAIGFVTGGMGGAVQVFRENRSSLGEWRKAGFSDKDIDGIILPVMNKAYNQQFKAAVFNSVRRELDRMQEQAEVKSSEKVPVLDVDGNPITLGDIGEQEKFKYRDRTVTELEKADKFEREGEEPVATKDAEAEVKERAEDPAIQARINQIEAELKPLVKEVQPLINKLEAGTLSKQETKRLSKLKKEISRREVERDEVGFDFSGATIEDVPVGAQKTIRLKAGQLARARVAEVKEQIRQFRAGLKTGKAITKKDIKTFQDRLVEIIDSSDVLTDTQKKRLLKTVRSTQTEGNFNKRLLKLDTIIKHMENANGRKVYSDAINRILRKAKKRKFDVATRKLFDELIALNKEQGLDPDVFQQAFDGSIQSILKFDIANVNSIDPSMAELRTAFRDLKNVFEVGVDKLNLERNQKKQELKKNIETVNKDIAGKHKSTKADPNAQELKKSRRRVWPIGMFTFGTIVNRITRPSGKKEGQSWTEKRFDTQIPFELSTKIKFVFSKDIKNAYQNAFGLENDNDILNRQYKDQSELQVFTWTIEETEKTAREDMSVELTRTQMRKRWMEWQRGVGRRTLENKNKYTEELMEDMGNRLTEGDFQFIKAQFRMYDSLYNIANPIYRKHKGMDLPYDEFYSHLFTTGGADMDVSTIDTMAGQSGQSFFNSKITSKDVFKKATGGSSGLKPIGDLFAVHKYINDMAHFIAYADLATDVETILLAPDTKANIEANFGTAVNKFFQHEFKRMQLGRTETNTNPAWEWVTNFIRPISRMFLAKPVIGVKQLVSMTAYMAEVPPQHFARFASDFINPTELPEVRRVMNFFRGDLMIQSRGDTFEREVKATREAARNTGDLLSTDEKLKANKWLLGSMRMGDRGAIYMGSYIMYRYDTEVRKVSHEKAMAKFRKFTNRTQQSPDPFQLPPALSDNNPIAHTLTIFTQAPVQYFNAMARTVFNAKTTGPTETARKLFVYHALLPMLWQLVANGFRWDNEEELSALILGPAAYIHIVGDGLKNFTAWGISKVFDSQNPQWRTDVNVVESWIKTVGKTVSEVHKLIEEGGLDDADTFKLLQDLAASTAPVTGAIGGATQFAVGAVRGVTKVLDGEYAAALQKFIGFSDYTVEKGGG